MFLERALVRSPLSGMLAVDKRIILLTVLRAMRKGNLDVLALQMNDRIQSGGRHVVVQQVRQPVAANDAVPVVIDGQSGIQIGIVTEHRLDIFYPEMVTRKKRVVRLEKNVRAVFLRGRACGVTHQIPPLEHRLTHLSVTETPCHEP